MDGYDVDGPTYWLSFYSGQEHGLFEFKYRIISSLSEIEDHLRQKTEVPFSVLQCIHEHGRKEATRIYPIPLGISWGNKAC